MHKNLFKNIVFYIIGLIIFILGAIFYLYNPSTNSFFLKCPIKYFTGFSCPGCGSQRAIHELLHLNFKKAFEYNAMLVLSLPFILVGIAFNFDTIKNRFPKTRNLLSGQKTILIYLMILILFSIFRNI